MLHSWVVRVCITWPLAECAESAHGVIHRAPAAAATALLRKAGEPPVNMEFIRFSSCGGREGLVVNTALVCLFTDLCEESGPLHKPHNSCYVPVCIQ